MFGDEPRAKPKLWKVTRVTGPMKRCPRRKQKPEPPSWESVRELTKTQRKEAVRTDFVLEKKKTKGSRSSPSRGLGAQPGAMEGPGDEKRGLW